MALLWMLFALVLLVAGREFRAELPQDLGRALTFLCWGGAIFSAIYAFTLAY